MAAALYASVLCAFVLGDKVYGSDKSLRVMLECHDKPYVLSIRGNERLMMGDFHTHTAEALAAGISSGEWRRLPAGEGAKGPRLDDWAKPAKGFIARSLMAEVWPAEGRLRLFRFQAPPWDHWLLIHRAIADPAGMAFYVTFGPPTPDLNEPAAVAGLRWTIEECFQSAKGILRQAREGLAHCEARSWGAVLARPLAARSWHGWHRHMPPSMVALAFLSGLRARLKETQIDIASAKANKRSPSAAA